MKLSNGLGLLSVLLVFAGVFIQVWGSRPLTTEEIATSDIIPFPKGDNKGTSPQLPSNFGPRTKSESESKSANPLAYDPTWESLDTRPLPAWFDEAKIGIFIHWGVYSVPAISAWFWLYWKIDQRPDIMQFMYENYPPGFTYANFATQFTAEFYNATEWTELFKKSGAKYVVLTSKHHEGYTLWPSKYSFSWNSQDVGSHRDLLGELATAIRTHSDLRFGLYYSLLEWFNPLFMADKASNLTTDDFVHFKMLPEVYELVNKYHPEVMWGDGEWEATDDYWQTREFLAWLYNESPVKDSVVVNDRWGYTTLCKHGGFYTCADRYNPGVLQPQKWENAMTLDINSWGYKRISRISDYLTPHQLIRTLIETVACGGNILVNVGPTKDGSIIPIQEERLLQMGEWLAVNGEAIYASDPWTAQNDTVTPGVWYTTNKDRSKVYVMLTFWPADGIVQLGSVDTSIVGSMQMLGGSTGVAAPSWSTASPGITVTLPPLQSVNSQYAYTIVITVGSGSGGGGGASPRLESAYATNLILLPLIFLLKSFT